MKHTVCFWTLYVFCKKKRVTLSDCMFVRLSENISISKQCGQYWNRNIGFKLLWDK